MIDLPVQPDDPRLWIALAVAGLVLLLVLLLVLSIRASGRAARAAEPVAGQMAWLSQSVQQMAQGQQIHPAAAVTPVDWP